MLFRINSVLKSASICVICGLLLGLVLTGCAGMQENGDVSQYTLIVTKRTEYFKTSPDQPTPPDGRLEEGTRLRVLQMNGENAKIETTYGMQVWINANAIGPMPVNTYQPTGG